MYKLMVEEKVMEFRVGHRFRHGGKSGDNIFKFRTKAFEYVYVKIRETKRPACRSQFIREEFSLLKVLSDRKICLFEILELHMDVKNSGVRGGGQGCCKCIPNLLG